MLEYLRRDDETRVVLMYMEGVRKGERLVETLRATTREKPVVASMGDVAASGGYSIAAPADTILASPATST